MISHKVQPSFPSSFFRREAIARIGTLVCGSYLFGGTVGVIAADTLYPTPAQIEGPFYPKIMPAEADWNLLKVGLNSFLIGEPLKLYGKVFDLSGFPLAEARVELWQCDGQGIYNHPRAQSQQKFDVGFQGFGVATTDVEGRYKFFTLMPVSYANRPPHIHIKIKYKGREILTTQLYIKDHPENNKDGLLSLMLYPGQNKLMIDPQNEELENGLTGKSARFDFVLGKRL